MWILSRNLCADIKVLAALDRSTAGLSSRREPSPRSGHGLRGAPDPGGESADRSDGALTDEGAVLVD